MRSGRSAATSGSGCLPKWGATCAGLCLLAAFVFYASFVSKSYPPERWLFFFYARCWAMALLFALASLAAGWKLLALLVPLRPRMDERLVLAFALGVLTFAWGVFTAGLLGLFGRTFFILWPTALVVFGAPATVRNLLPAWVRLRPFGIRPFLPKTILSAAACLFMVISVIAVYLQVITPSNLGADAHGYHLPIAEHYVAAGAIRPFAEGWYLGTYPQLASLLYTWALLAPGTLADHTALCSHLEFVLFLATLGGISVLAGRLVGRRIPFASAALFLFPGIYLYDSNLITTADHVLAFWAPPLALSLLRLASRFTTSEGVLVGVLTAAAVLTKYQGSYFFVASCISVLVLSVQARRIRPVFYFGFAFLLVSSAHWLKSAVFYGDPFYPLLGQYLPAHPLHEGAARYYGPLFRPPWATPHGPFGRQVLQTFKVLATFSFVPHGMLGPTQPPYFGSLFTLLLPVLLFLRAPRRLWALVVLVHITSLWWSGGGPSTQTDSCRSYRPGWPRVRQPRWPWPGRTASLYVLAWLRS
jgi:hypothetical protein